MFKLIFTNSRGESIELFGRPYRLIRVEGLLDGVGAELQSQRAPYQDGDTLVDTFLEPRYGTIEIKIVGKDETDIETKRRKLSSVFNPKLQLGTLKYVRGQEVKGIQVVSESTPSFPDGPTNRGRAFQKALISLKAPNPYWTTEEQVDQLVVWEGGLTFPLRLPTTFSTMSQDKSKILLNEGDVETPIFIVFEGPATSPITVENKTTGEHITIKQDLLDGERLEINTAFGQKRVTKVLADGTRQNAFHYIDIASRSSFFNLVPGNNLIDYSTGQDFERAGVTITWRNRFVAV